jgi:hypothetical protein
MSSIGNITVANVVSQFATNVQNFLLEYLSMVTLKGLGLAKIVLSKFLSKGKTHKNITANSPVMKIIFNSRFPKVKISNCRKAY